MNISFNEEEIMIQDTAKQFADAELRPNAALVEQHQEQPRFLANLKKLSELGFMGINVDSQYGGCLLYTSDAADE